VEHLHLRILGLQWREANILKPVARSELMLNSHPIVHGHDCGFQPCAVPVLVAATRVDRPGSTWSKSGELMWLVSSKPTGLCSTEYPPRTRQLDDIARDSICVATDQAGREEELISLLHPSPSSSNTPTIPSACCASSQPLLTRLPIRSTSTQTLLPSSPAASSAQSPIL
jgi:hypothetical protein